MMDVASRTTVKRFDTAGKELGGVPLQGPADFWILVSGEKLQLLELHMHEGFFHPRHNHPENESIGYVISGRLQMGIGDREYVLEPGDAWHHAMGVYHWTRALADTVAVEIHAPLRAEYSDPSG